MSYQGYLSYQEEISQTQLYQCENNRNDQTYEQSSRLFSIDALNDITYNNNKISISQALKSTFLKSIDSVDQSSNQNAVRKNNVSTQKKYKLNKYLPLQITQKSKAKHLLYFKENISQKENEINEQKLFVVPKSNKQNLLINKKTFKAQDEERIKTSNPKISINQKIQQIEDQATSLKYFAKNPKNEWNKQKQIMITSRSGYNLAISNLFLENITKKYVHQNNEISLKQKIQLKLNQEKHKKLKTFCYQDYNLKNHQKSKSKLYKPLNLNCQNPLSSRVILSTESFQDRQAKTLKNKKNRVDKIKQEKLQSEIKQCTFKPKTNLLLKSKPKVLK